MEQRWERSEHTQFSQDSVQCFCISNTTMATDFPIDCPRHHLQCLLCSNCLPFPWTPARTHTLPPTLSPQISERQGSLPFSNRITSILTTSIIMYSLYFPPFLILANILFTLIENPQTMRCSQISGLVHCVANISHCNKCIRLVRPQPGFGCGIHDTIFHAKSELQQ